jgi:hypothetical protein
MALPILIQEPNFQLAWVSATRALMSNRWNVKSLAVHIANITSFDESLHYRYENFCQNHGLLGPKHVAYTIFPHGLYNRYNNADSLFEAYNRPGGFYDRLRHRARGGWGTYFRRMTYYETPGGITNQLGSIVRCINERNNLYVAAYTMIIQKPGGETVRPRGGPCLNYLAVQMEPSQQNTLGLLAVYRNQDFLNRAYGNYWGLCNLLHFLSDQTACLPGSLTCISSNAYVSALMGDLSSLLEALDEMA